MSCSCQQPAVNPDLPTIEQDCAISKPTSLCKTCVSDDTCLKSDSSDGTTLTSSWQDAGCYSEGVTILGRVGSKLARFAGSGFIKLESGVASVVSAVPLRAITLWHRWWKPSAASPPILGEPLAYPYQAVADTDGNIHGIKGVDAEDSISMWNSTTKEFSQTPVSEINHTKKGVFDRASEIELTGFAPIANGGDAETVRPEKALSGKGLVILTEQATISNSCNCAPGSGTASVASTLALPVPVADETYTLKYSTALGLYWSEDA